MEYFFKKSQNLGLAYFNHMALGNFVKFNFLIPNDDIDISMYTNI